MYQRNLQIIKGIDNVLTFEIKNQDQKPTSILNTYTCKFIAYDENNTEVLNKTGTIKETATPKFKGQFTINVTANDTLNLKGQYLTYFVHLVDSNNNDIITYADSQFGARGTINLDTDTLPGPKESYSVKTFSETDSNTFISETISAEPALNGNEALHTSAIYSTGFTGTVTVQGTLENQITGTTAWVDIASATYTNPSQPQYINFNGVFSHIRFQYNKTAGTVDKVLVRN